MNNVISHGSIKYIFLLSHFLDVLNAVFNLPQDAHPCLRLTSLKLIGDLHMWISHNSENWLEQSVQYLLAGLTVGPELNIRKDFQVKFDFYYCTNDFRFT